MRGTIKSLPTIVVTKPHLCTPVSIGASGFVIGIKKTIAIDVSTRGDGATRPVTRALTDDLAIGHAEVNRTGKRTEYSVGCTGIRAARVLDTRTDDHIVVAIEVEVTGLDDARFATFVETLQRDTRPPEVIERRVDLGDDLTGANGSGTREPGFVQDAKPLTSRE